MGTAPPVSVLAPLQVTWQEYDGLRIVQRLLQPTEGGCITLDMRALREREPGWVDALEAAQGWLTRVLLSYQVQDALVQHRGRAVEARRKAAQALRAQGMGLAAIAERLGVSTSTAAAYCKGQRKRRGATSAPAA